MKILRALCVGAWAGFKSVRPFQTASQTVVRGFVAGEGAAKREWSNAAKDALRRDDDFVGTANLTDDEQAKILSDYRRFKS